MLLQAPAPVEKRCPRPWLLTAAAGLLSLAVLGAGVGLRAAPAPPADESKKDSPKKEQPAEEPKKAEPRDEPARPQPRRPRVPGVMFPDIEELLKGLPGGIDPEQLKQLREQNERAMKELQKALEQAGQLPGFPGVFPPAVGRPGVPGRAGRTTHESPRLGAQLEQPGATLADQLDLPKGQGVVLEAVGADSAAAKAGLKAHDILLELNGKPVPSSLEEFARLLAGIKPDTPIEAVVLRKGRKETIKGLSLPAGKAVKAGAADNPLGALPGALGRIPGLGLGGLNGMTTVTRSRDRVTARHQDGDVVITLTGPVADGKAKVDEIQIQEGDKVEKYDSVDKVPEQHRDKVKKLVEMAEKGKRRIEIRRP